MMRKNQLLWLLLFLNIWLPGLRAEQNPPKRTHTVLIKGFAFSPERIEVTAGDTVIWKNEDIVPHTASAKQDFESKGIDAGKSWSFVATEKGRHPYICKYHPSIKGELIVK